jgi:cyclic beta-1,2-glucan synthetase
MPYIGIGDWNDGMNRVGVRGQGETVWGGMFLLLVLSEFLPICEIMGDEHAMKAYPAVMKQLACAIESEAWNGKWYRRAWYDDGCAMGNPGDAEAAIDLLPQAFAAIVNHRVRLPGGGKPFDEERVHTAMNYAYETLFDEAHGVFALLYPPFGSSERADNPNPGYIAGYPPGARENGGQYTHAAVWGAMGLFAVGEHERGMRVVEALLPTSHLRDAEGLYRYQKEPWALCGDVLTTPGRVGEGGWSLYTGSAGWYYRLLLSLFGENHEHSDT